MSEAIRVPRVAELLNLTGKTLLVTGSSGGIGAGIAGRLYEAGANVMVHATANRAGVEGVAAALNNQVSGNRVAVVMGDVERDAERLIAETIAHFGRIDGLINNAGIQPVKPLLEITQQDSAEMMRVNVQGVMALSGVAARRMISQADGGAIVNIASIEGLQPALNHAHYASSKAALLMYTRAAALELGRHGIRVNAIAPGLIHRDGLEAAWPDGVNRWRAAAPLTRLGMPEDVADAALFLISSGARWITGATLVVDGGMLTNNVW
jgi:NAD(P)-dependent dehydrogenase (short-subunit alcohol dehydrogenase family)